MRVNTAKTTRLMAVFAVEATNSKKNGGTVDKIVAEALEDGKISWPTRKSLTWLGPNCHNTLPPPVLIDLPCVLSSHNYTIPGLIPHANNQKIINTVLVLYTLNIYINIYIHIRLLCLISNSLIILENILLLMIMISLCLLLNMRQAELFRQQ